MVTQDESGVHTTCTSSHLHSHLPQGPSGGPSEGLSGGPFGSQWIWLWGQQTWPLPSFSENYVVNYFT